MKWEAGDVFQYKDSRNSHHLIGVITIKLKTKYYCIYKFDTLLDTRNTGYVEFSDDSLFATKSVKIDPSRVELLKLLYA